MTKKKKTKRAAKKKTSAKIFSQKEGLEQAGLLPKVTPYPAAGPKVVGFEQKLDEQLADGDKPKRGRPPKPPEPEPAQVPNEIVKQAVQVPFDLWAISQNLKGLKLDAKEAAMLSEPVKTLLDYYLPQLPVIAIAWASLTISTYAVMKPRLEMIAAIKKQKAVVNEAGEARGSGLPPQGQGGPHPPNSPPAGQGKIVEFPEQIKTQKL